MPSFDWQRFCNVHNIYYVTSGSSWTIGNINIHCPFCGDADPSYHMGLHLKKGFWHCWRNDRHAGRKPHRLIMRLLGCSYGEAATYVDDTEVELSDFDEEAFKFTNKTEDLDKNRSLYLPKQFRRLTSSKGRAKIYWSYLQSRGFKNKELLDLSHRYELYYCDKGKWRGRIIIPIRIEGQLISWTGRTVYETEDLRYKSLSHKRAAEPRGLINIRDVLFNYDNATKRRYRICVVTEGPWDAIKIDFYGYKNGICSVATFGTGIREAQLELLENIKQKCDTLVICGDANAEANVMDLSSSMQDMKPIIIDLPPDVGDPGELTKENVRALFTDV